MVRPKNRRLSDLSAWAADPVKMQRFEAVALLCQRTGFVKSFLCLTDSDSLIRDQIQRVCERHEFSYKVPRGTGFEVFHRKSMGPDVRYASTVLLNIFLNTDDGGLTFADLCISNDALVDRLVYTYRRYLRIFLIPVGESPVSFDLFVRIYKAYLSGEIEMAFCGNCDSRFTNFMASQSIKCAVCQTHHHAEIPKNVTLSRPQLPDAHSASVRRIA